MSDSKEYKDLERFALSISIDERRRIAKDSVGRMEHDLKVANAEVQKLIVDASKMPITNGMRPSIFVAVKLDSGYHVGINYQPEGVTVGHQFHYDHGVGIERNTDAMVHWIKSA